jgi:hypothetical protein
VRVLPLCDELRFVAAPGRHELLGGGFDGGGVGVGAVGAGDSLSPLAHPPASSANNITDPIPTRITDTPLTRTSATVVPWVTLTRGVQLCAPALTIPNASDQFCS